MPTKPAVILLRSANRGKKRHQVNHETEDCCFGVITLKALINIKVEVQVENAGTIFHSSIILPCCKAITCQSTIITLKSSRKV